MPKVRLVMLYGFVVEVGDSAESKFDSIRFDSTEFRLDSIRFTIVASFGLGL